MKNSSFFVLCLFASINLLFSQEYEVKGTIVNLNNTAVVFANVVLLAEGANTIVKGTATDVDGSFVFEAVSAGSYSIKASYIGSTSQPLNIEVSKHIDVGSIIISETEVLDEVVITYEKPTLERKVDRLVFNVKNTALSDGTIWELLEQTPSVSIVENVLTIKGNSNIGVLINGRKVNLPEADIINLLSGASAGTVEAIEVITSPPSKYSAEGGMLIDIKMKKNLVSGYRGAVFNNFKQGIFAKNTLGTDHYFKGKKTGFSVNYSFSNTKEVIKDTDITNFFENDYIGSIWSADQESIIRNRKHTISAFFDYAIDEKNALSVSTINSLCTQCDKFLTSETKIVDLLNNSRSSFSTLNDSDQGQLNTSFYADWVRKLKKKGAEISLGGHYTFYDSKIGQDLATDFFDGAGSLTGENNFNTQSDQKINLFSFQTDLTFPLQRSSKIESGLRYAQTNSESLITQEGFDRNQPGINPTEVGVFTYDESIYAAYTSFDGAWELWDLKAGLRAEYTATKGKLNTVDDMNKNSYLEFFPSVVLQYTPLKQHQYALKYNRSIERPRYNRINPFQYFQSNNAVIEGNPDLLPSILNWFSVEYVFQRAYTFALYYYTWNNIYREQTFQDNENNLLRTISANIPGISGYGFDFMVNKDVTTSWNFYLFISGYFNGQRFRDLDTGQLLSNDIWTGFVRFTNNLKWLQDRSLVASLNFAYYAPKTFGNTHRSSFNRLNLTVRKTFMNKNASVSLGVVDIFNQGNRLWSRDYLNQNNSNFNRLENRLFTLGLRYKFGNVRIKDNKKSKKIEERKRI